MRDGRNGKRIDAIVREDAKKFGVRVLEFANVGNHLHLLVKVGTRKSFPWFLRSIAGRIAMLVTGARKGEPGCNFWDWRPFSRIVCGYRGYRVARDYVVRNRLEAEGLVQPRPKKTGPSG